MENETESSNIILITIVSILIAALGLVFLKIKSNNSVTASAKPGKIVQKGKTIYLMGECSAGKTSLLYKLKGDSTIDTVSSVETNETKIDLENSQNIPIIDIPGHSDIKQDFIKLLHFAKIIVLVVDAADQESYPSLAEYLYQILIQKSYQERQIPIVLALNKSDLPNALKPADFEHVFNKELENVKRSKRAFNDESEEIDDYIKHQDNLFQISENGIKLVQISVKNSDIKQLTDYLNNEY